MRNFTKLLIAAALTLALGTAYAQSTDSHTVTVTVEAINEIALTGGNITLTISSTTDGAPSDATDTTTSLDWSTNQSTKKITVATDQATPTFTLRVEATGVTGGTSAGSVTLSTTAQDFVTGISETSGSATLSYTASATLESGTGSEMRTVTYTITD